MRRPERDRQPHPCSDFTSKSRSQQRSLECQCIWWQVYKHTIRMHYNLKWGSLFLDLFKCKKLNQEIQYIIMTLCFYVCFFFLLLLGNGTEFSNKTLLHINSSSLHHRTTNEPSSSTATLSHLNMNKSLDEKIHNFKGENQGESIRQVTPFKE